jgi:5-methylcytosine-specific restriction endonuclease McrBC GTP-binding regulatory subunit McrB
MAARGLQFTPWQIATFYTALQTKGFVILSGISGTGKTKLAQHFAALLPQPADFPNWLFVPVRPDWRDSKSLLGYYNPLTSAYEWTQFLRFLLRAVQSYRAGDGLAWFVILDEMNLAHVEYYFADLLSVLESGRDEEGWTREPLRLGYPDDAEGDLPQRELRLPPNLYIVGTVNVDETTQSFSPKVLDRAFTLELTEADFSTYPPEVDDNQIGPNDTERRGILEDFTLDGAFVRIDKQIITDYLAGHPEVRTRLQALNDLLRPYDLHFGYRVFDEIVSFLAAAEHNKLFADLGDAETAFDAAVLMKVLPKFHGSRGKLEVPLRAVLAWCIDPDAPAEGGVANALKGVEAGNDVAKALAQLPYRYPRTAERARRMLRALYTDGFAAFG